MTAEALSAWRSRLDLTQAAAADAIGCGRRSWQMWETGQSPVPKYIALACAAVAKGVKPIGSTPKKRGRVSPPPLVLD